MVRLDSLRGDGYSTQINCVMAIVLCANSIQVPELKKPDFNYVIGFKTSPTTSLWK